MFLWRKKTGSNKTDQPPFTESYGYHVYSMSEAGPVRFNNEDALIYFQPGGSNDHALFAMVADGMGGHNAGEVASHIACTTGRSFIETAFRRNDIAKMLEEAFHHMHTAISTASATNALHQGMGTTATAIFLKNNHLHFGHVGDSRLYRYSADRLLQLTSDQTLLNKMIREGSLQPGDEGAAGIKHILMQALGTVDTIRPEISKQLFVQKGDSYMLCSDGVYEIISDDEILSLLRMRNSPLALECIKHLCYQRGGSDNFSVILVDVVSKTMKADLATREQNVML